MAKLESWLAGGAKSPREGVIKKRLRVCCRHDLEQHSN